MWRRCYWARLPAAGDAGIVVLFAWLSSKERQLRPHVRLYESAGWSCLVCHSQFISLFFPEKAQSLADTVTKELVKPLKIKPVPVVFTSFSGGPKGCTYKVLQLIQGQCNGQLSMEEYQLVRECLSGQIYDSSPVDFTHDIGARFVLHPSVLKMSEPPRILSWMVNNSSSALDVLFKKRFEADRADYWHTLYSSANVGPFLVICCEDDELAPYAVIHRFTECLRELGASVNLVKLEKSAHVGHYKYHPQKYRVVVEELLEKATQVYAERSKGGFHNHSMTAGNGASTMDHRLETHTEHGSLTTVQGLQGRQSPGIILRHSRM